MQSVVIFSAQEEFRDILFALLIKSVESVCFGGNLLRKRAGNEGISGIKSFYM